MKLEELVGKKLTEAQFDEAAGEKDACYHKVKARYDVWPSAYASGALVKCRKVGAKNWGNKSKKENMNEAPDVDLGKKLQKIQKQIYALGHSYSNKANVPAMMHSFLIGLKMNLKKGKLLEKMRPQVKKLLKQKGYNPIFGAIDNSKRQLKQMRYSRGEIQDTLISMFGDEDPKILQRIKESINEKKGDFLDSLFPKSKVAKAVKIAHEMGGDMTGAVKKIERYFKGMTLHSKVRDALQQANESINESEQDKIKQFLIKKGDNEKDATEKLKYYDMVSKMYKGANSTKKAEIMSSLWANEAVNNPSFFDSFSITEVRKMSDRELKDYLLYMKKYKPDVWNHMKKNKDLKKMIRKLRVESVNEGVSKSQAQEIMNQLGGRKFEMLMGVKSKGIGKDGLILHIGKNPKRVSHIIIDLDRGRDLYNLTFGKIVKYQFKVIKKLKGIYVDQLHDMIEKYTGNLTTFRPRR